MHQTATLAPATHPTTASAGDATDASQTPASPGRVTYLAVLTWAFTLFNSVRTVAYLPTMWSIWVSGDSSQHSLWTWCTWLGANATMAAWLYEHNGQRINRAVTVNIGNACMCAATVVLIVAHRVWLW